MTTREQHEQLFKSLDKDGSGTLTQEELIGAIMKRNPKQDEAQLKRYFKSVDTSADKQISLDEYLAAMGFIPMPKQDYMRGVFNEFDLNGDHMISRDEMRSAIGNMDLTESQLDRLVGMCDTSADAKIDYEEFIARVFKQ